MLKVLFLVTQWMEAGPTGVHGPFVISAVVAAARYALAPAPALHPKMVGRSVSERKTRSSRATPNLVVRFTEHRLVEHYLFM